MSTRNEQRQTGVLGRDGMSIGSLASHEGVETASQKRCVWKGNDLTLPEERDGIPGKGDRVHQSL